MQELGNWYWAGVTRGSSACQEMARNRQEMARKRQEMARKAGNGKTHFLFNANNFEFVTSRKQSSSFGGNFIVKYISILFEYLGYSYKNEQF